MSRARTSAPRADAPWLVLIAALAAGCSAAKETPKDASTGSSADARDAAVADVRTGGDANSDAAGTAQFGIAVRPAKQTCSPPADPDKPADRLSATGCTDPADVKKPAASLIPYDVASPLWSDGADKQRFMAIPDGAKIHVKNCTTEPDTCKFVSQGGTSFDEGHFIMPIGTVLVKNFLFAGKLVETRLFINFADIALPDGTTGPGWGGYSYQWNAAQTEAVLVADTGATAGVVNASGATQQWTFPTRSNCLECHTDTAGFSLGPDTRQLNGLLKYPSGVTANQIATLEHIGLFDAPVVRMPALADYRLTSATVEDRARSYLHSNCAICHRPDGAYSAIDLRAGVTLASMKICNLDPNKGDIGVTGAKRLIPGAPDRSLMVLRMQAPDKASGRMPQLATSVLDTLGISLVSQWVQGITSCP